jgi:RNA polymerase sigma factor (sigma-70 family)
MRKILRNHLSTLRAQFKDTHKRQVGREAPLAEAPLELLRNSLADPAPTPSRQAAANEQREAIERGLAQLPERYARVIRLRHLDSRSFANIATQLGCSAEAARKLWTRALKQLREILERSP